MFNEETSGRLLRHDCDAAAMADDVSARNSSVHYVIVGSNHVECFNGSTVSAGRWSHRRSIIYSLLYNNCPEPVGTEAERVEGWGFCSASVSGSIPRLTGHCIADSVD